MTFGASETPISKIGLGVGVIFLANLFSVHIFTIEKSKNSFIEIDYHFFVLSSIISLVFFLVERKLISGRRSIKVSFCAITTSVFVVFAVAAIQILRNPTSDKTILLLFFLLFLPL